MCRNLRSPFLVPRFLLRPPPFNISSKFLFPCRFVGFVGLFSSGGQSLEAPVNMEEQNNLNCRGRYLRCLVLVAKVEVR